MLLLEKNKNPEDIIMEKNRKWGYIYDEKLNMYAPDFPRQRKFAKVLLVLSAISFIAASVQGFFLDKTSYEQISILIYSIVAIFLFLSLYAVIKINIRLIEKRLKLIGEVKKINSSEKFEIRPLKKNMYLFFCIIVFIMMIFALSFQINKLLEVFSFEFITYLLFLIGMIIFSYINFLKELKNRKYSLFIDGKIIKIYYENDEMEYIKTNNIDYVRFYSIRHGRKARREKYPTLQIFDIEEKKLAEMTINLNDYYLLKKYFAENNVAINDQYEDF